MSAAASAADVEGSPAVPASPTALSAPSLDLAVPDAVAAARLTEMEMDEHMSNMAAAVLSNRPSYMIEPMPPQPDEQIGFIAEQAAAASSLMPEDPETFALEPIDINTMGLYAIPLIYYACVASVRNK